MMRAYYNENDKKKCAALKALMDDNLITLGEIDDRSIHDVQPDELRDYDRCHFFAGIGLWDYALNLARWPEGVRVWTGSCPCQSFSTAGRQRGKTDDRHLWPEWLRLIEECRPSVLLGEQVANAVTFGWLDDVYQGLEAQNYAVGSAVLPACSVGAPHKRDRLWFVADLHNKHKRSTCTHQKGSSNLVGESEECSTERGTLGDTKHHGSLAPTVKRGDGEAICYNTQRENSPGKCTGASYTANVADTGSQRPQGHGGLEQKPIQEGRERAQRHPWASGVWIDCPDGKQRLVEPTIPLLAYGYPERVGLLHAAGDGIVPQVAAEFIKAYMETMTYYTTTPSGAAMPIYIGDEENRDE